jgi:hypothetical protein
MEDILEGVLLLKFLKKHEIKTQNFPGDFSGGAFFNV